MTYVCSLGYFHLGERAGAYSCAQQRAGGPYASIREHAGAYGSRACGNGDSVPERAGMCCWKRMTLAGAYGSVRECGSMRKRVLGKRVSMCGSVGE